ncbi:PstC family ABC transporter permease [Enhygromyxa salina]|uniref:PstC family ABC transporter permease n=1 Tax=Enhygromyxa salina TaxID=215803 RepID=UPI0015E62659|nr:ABC transporter permease subunit [Enhygromyxa salina]
MLGTALTTAIALAVAVPLGLLAAIYLAEFATAELRRVIDPTFELLGGVPTVVLGYVALVFLTPMLQRAVPGLSSFNALSPGVVIGVMIVPMIASLSCRAIEAVPLGLREGAWALGVGEARTIVKIVLPAAASGVGASILLASSRAIGETMIVAIAAVAAGQGSSSGLDPRGPVQTMTAYIVQTPPTDAAVRSTIFALGASLFVLTVALNLVAQRMVPRARAEGGHERA